MPSSEGGLNKQVHPHHGRVLSRKNDSGSEREGLQTQPQPGRISRKLCRVKKANPKRLWCARPGLDVVGEGASQARGRAGWRAGVRPQEALHTTQGRAGVFCMQRGAIKTF